MLETDAADAEATADDAALVADAAESPPEALLADDVVEDEHPAAMTSANTQAAVAMASDRTRKDIIIEPLPSQMLQWYHAHAKL